MKLLYDGECPLCLKEVDMLRSRDAKINGDTRGLVSLSDTLGVESRNSVNGILAQNGLIQFVDISHRNYDPQYNEGITFSLYVLLLMSMNIFFLNMNKFISTADTFFSFLLVRNFPTSSSTKALTSKLQWVAFTVF